MGRPRRRRSRPALSVACLAPALLAAPGPAQDEPPVGWSNRAELSVVAVEGNSESTSFGFNHRLAYEWPGATFSLQTSGIRAESTTTRRTARGTPGAFVVEEVSDTELTAENYRAHLAYDRDLTDRFFWHAAGTWEQDEFAGVDRRLTGAAGVGSVFWDEEDRRLFRIDGALTYTEEQAVGAAGLDDETFAGARVGWNWMRRLTASTQVGDDTSFDWNLDDTADLRVTTTLWLAVAMSEQLSLKTSLQAKYDAEPAFASVDLFDPAGRDTGEDVPVQLDELDTILSVALVVDF